MKFRDDFAALVRNPEARLDVGALLIAAEEYPDLDIAHSIGTLDLMAADLSDAVAAQVEPRAQIELINAYLFESKGFHGNREEYNDPRNSFLNDVLERRTGLPITLSVVYVELARRLGLPIVGVGFPGHFLVKYDGPDPIVIDPFNEGMTLNESGCRTLLRRFYGNDVDFDPSMLGAWPTVRILHRILANLRALYLQIEELPKALSVVERMLLIEPADDRLRTQAREIRAALARRN